VKGVRGQETLARGVEKQGGFLSKRPLGQRNRVAYVLWKNSGETGSRVELRRKKNTKKREKRGGDSQVPGGVRCGGILGIVQGK